MSNLHQDPKVIVGIFILSSLNKKPKNETKMTAIPMTSEEKKCRQFDLKNNATQCLETLESVDLWKSLKSA